MSQPSPRRPSALAVPLALGLPFALAQAACGHHKLVATAPHVALLDAPYAADDVHTAIVRTITHDDLTPQGEAPGLVAVATMSHTCAFRIQYAPTQVVVETVPMGALPLTLLAPDGSTVAPLVDRKCLLQADRIARDVAREAISVRAR